MRIERYSFSSFDLRGQPANDFAKKEPDTIEELEVIPAVIVPTFSEEQLEIARKEGFSDGYSAGLETGMQRARKESDGISEKLTSVSHEMIGQLQEAMGSYRQFLHMQIASASKLAINAARKVAGKALGAQPLSEIITMIEHTLPMLVEEPKVTIAVHPELTAALEQHLKERSAGETELPEPSIIADESIEPGDCRVEWKNGSAERNTEQLWRSIERIVEQHMPAIAATDLPNSGNADETVTVFRKPE